MSATVLTPKQFFELCDRYRVTQAIQFLESLPIDQRHDFVSYRDRQGRTPIFVAAEYGDHQAVKILLAAGVDKNDVTIHGITPIWLAAHTGGHEVVEVLLTVGADMNTANNNSRYTPIHVAAFGGHHSVVELTRMLLISVKEHPFGMQLT